MSYQDDLIAHLVSYKRTQLGDPPAGTFRHRGKDLAYEHILPKRSSQLNFLAESRDEIVTFLRAHPQVKLHRYFHHLNSSQAFALNLFVPFFEGGRKASSSLLAALGQKGDLLRWEPEAIPDLLEETNLDAVWETNDGVKTFCEVKLSERDFGKARHDDRHLAKLREIYLPRLAPDLSPELQTTAGFFGSYQILRNVWHMVGTPKGRLIFLIPRRNARLWPLLETVRAGVAQKVRSRIHCVAIEDVLDSLAENTASPTRFRGLARQLREKYVPTPQAT